MLKRAVTFTLFDALLVVVGGCCAGGGGGGGDASWWSGNSLSPVAAVGSRWEGEVITSH